MYKLKVWWAAHLLKTVELESTDTADEIVDDLQERINCKEITLHTCGLHLPVTGLCIDLLLDEKIVKMYNLKT